MNYNIRSYQHSDFETLCSWYEGYNQPKPLEGMFCEDGTFILEVDNQPVISQSVLFTQSKQICFLELCIKNPKFKSINLESILSLLWDHIFSYSRSKGYKNIFGYALEEKLKNKYVHMGLTRVSDNLSSFSRTL